MKQLLPLTTFLILSCSTASSQIYRVAQMNTEQIRAPDRQKTVVILPGGMLEEHGPHLPSFTDGYSNEWLTQKLAGEIVRRTQMSVLLSPIIPLGDADDHSAENIIRAPQAPDQTARHRQPQQGTVDAAGL